MAQFLFGPLLTTTEYHELVHALTWKPGGDFGGYSYGLNEVLSADVNWFRWAIKNLNSIRTAELKRAKSAGAKPGG